MSYFQNYPKILVNSLTDNSSIEITDFFRRLKLTDIFLKNKDNYIDYYNATALRPEQIAYQIYGDNQYFWTILLSNNIINYEKEWALSDVQLDTYINKLHKYPDVISHFKTIEIRNDKNKIILKSDLIVPDNYQFTYAETVYTSINVRIPITFREIEIEKNERKKSLKLVKRSAISLIEQEFEELIKYQSTYNLDAYGRKTQER